jgi:hypothetical protein
MSTAGEIPTLTTSLLLAWFIKAFYDICVKEFLTGSFCRLHLLLYLDIFHDTGGQSPSFHRRRTGPIRGQSLLNIYWPVWNYDSFFSKCFGFPSSVPLNQLAIFIADAIKSQELTASLIYALNFFGKAKGIRKLWEKRSVSKVYIVNSIFSLELISLQHYRH